MLIRVGDWIKLTKHQRFLMLVGLHTLQQAERKVTA
jgi:hypothetical protein